MRLLRSGSLRDQTRSLAACHGFFNSSWLSARVPLPAAALALGSLRRPGPSLAMPSPSRWHSDGTTSAVRWERRTQCRRRRRNNGPRVILRAVLAQGERAVSARNTSLWTASHNIEFCCYGALSRQASMYSELGETSPDTQFGLSGLREKAIATGEWIRAGDCRRTHSLSETEASIATAT